MPEAADDHERVIAALRDRGAGDLLGDSACALVIWSLDEPRLLWRSPNAAGLAGRLADGEGRPTGLAETVLPTRPEARVRIPRDRFRFDRVRLGSGRLAPASLVGLRIIAVDGRDELLTAFPGQGDPARPAEAARRAAPPAEPPPPRAEPEAVDGVPTGSADESPAPAEAAPAQAEPPASREGRRFVFRADDQGRFTYLSRHLAEVVGPANADALGWRWTELEGAVVQDEAGEIAAAFAGHRSWARVPVLWRGEGPDRAIPGELSGVPVRGPDGRPGGFRGFGLLFPDRPRAVEPGTFRDLPAAARRPPIPEESGAIDQAFETAAAITGSASDTMLGVFRAFFSRVSNDVLPVSGPADLPDLAAGGLPAVPGSEAPRAAAGRGLSEKEQGALDEIARTLGARVSAGAPSAAPDPDPEEVPSPPEAAPPASGPLRELLDLLPVGVAVLREGAPVFINRHLREAAGLPDPAAGDAPDPLAILPEGALERAAAAQGEAVEGHLPAAGGDRPVLLRVAPAEWGGRPASLLSVVPAPASPPREEIRAAEAALAESARTARDLRGALALAADAALVVDAGGRIAAVQAVPGRSAAFVQAAAGLPLTDLIRAEDHRVAVGAFTEAREGGLDHVAEREVVLAGQGGPMLMRVALIQEVPASYCVLFRDLSAGKRLEAELRDAQARIRQQGVSRADFLARVSHDIRTPLTAITGFAELMLEDDGCGIAGERARGYVQDIHRSGSQVLALVNDLVELARADSGGADLAPVPLDLTALARLAVAQVGPAAAKERTIIRTGFAPNLPAIRLDRTSMARALRNILAQAVRQAGAGGQVIVSTSRLSPGEVMLSVRNTGLGMTQGEIDAALSPSWTPSATRGLESHGVELPLSLALVKANKGRLAITGGATLGTLVEIRFPADQPAVAVIAAE